MLSIVIIYISAGKNREGRPVSSNHDTFLLIASSQQEMDEWIQAINRIIYAVSYVKLL